MGAIIIFHTQTEEILQTCKIYSDRQVPEDLAAIVFEARSLDPLEYSVRDLSSNLTTNEAKEECYIENGQPHYKEPMFCSADKTVIVANGVDKATISNCPEGVSVYFDNALVGEVGSDGLVEVTSSVPRKLNVRLEKMEYQTERITINAT